MDTKSIQLSTKTYNLPRSFCHQAATHLLAKHLLHEHSATYIYDATGKRETLNNILFDSNKKIWTKIVSNELGRLAQYNKHGVSSTDPIDLVYKHELPSQRSITYSTFLCDYKSLRIINTE